jgi:hypothetical protein
MRGSQNGEDHQKTLQDTKSNLEIEEQMERLRGLNKEQVYIPVI